MFLSRLRKPVDRFAPSVAHLYRSLRDFSVARQARQTTYGFRLAGEPRIAAGNFERSEVKLFLHLLESHDAVLDIGANIGFYSCLAASRGKHVMSFEPSQRNLQFLRRNLSENGFANVEIFPVGLAKEPGFRRLYGFSDMASFVTDWAQADRSRCALVPAASLDSILTPRFRGEKLLIKLDVEGFELDVLGGAETTLGLAPKPTWLIEILLRDEVIPGGINPHFGNVFDIFWNHGYECRRLDSGLPPVNRADVDSWISNGSVQSATQNFLFFGAPPTNEAQQNSD